MSEGSCIYIILGKHVSRVFEDLRKTKAPQHAACQAGKQLGTSHPSKNVMTTSRPLELLHMDLFGPVAYLSIGESKYGLVIIDECSCFTWVLFL
jgi:hypothetical protein